MPGNELANRIIKLIQDGKEAIDSQYIKPEIVIFIGITGAGKSALINYINGVQLESFSENGGVSYKLRAKDPATELPGIKIGQSTVTSCTRYPGVYSPQGKSFSYIDTAGFGDTGDSNVDNDSFTSEATKTARVAQDIANAYFRKLISERASLLKIVLVVTHYDLDNRAGTLPKSLRDFGYFLQGIQSDNPTVVDKIKNAVSIVVTKVNDPSQRISGIEEEIIGLKNAILALGDKSSGVESLNALLQTKEIELRSLRSRLTSVEQAVEISLKDFIEKSPALRTVKNMADVLTYVVNQRHFALFTTRAQHCDKTFNEASIILDLIENKTTFVTKEDASVDIKVSEENVSEVTRAIENLSVMAKKLAESIDIDISEQLKAAFEDSSFQIVKILTIKTGCEIVKDYTTSRTLKAFFDDVNQKLGLSKKTKKEYDEFNKLLTFLVQLLPETERGRYSDEKNWIRQLGLDAMLNRYVATATNILCIPQASFEDGKLTIQGYYVKTSQVDVEISKYIGIKSIEIQALHTITIDNDLSEKNNKCEGKLHGVNLSLMAPNLVVSGVKEINLSGKTGDPHTEAVTNGTGYDALGNGMPGTDGAPGKRGGSSGNLFVASDKFTGIDHLTVLLNGGKGGAGQRGGDGASGKDGVAWDPNNVASGLTGWEVEVKRHEIGNRTSLALLKHYGEAGKNGGKAGDGGVGGKGGNKGIGVILALSGNRVNEANILKNVGNDGDLGSAGTAGAGGNHGADAYRTYRWFHNGEKWDDDQHTSPNNTTGNRGAAGRTGANVAGIEAPEVIVSNQYLSILNYKIFLKKEVIKYQNIIGDFLHTFEAQCESIRTTDVETTTKYLLEEADVLEKYSFELGRNIDFAPLYYSLLARVKEFALSSARTAQEIIVLEYLYVATLGGVARINAAADNLLVIDIQGYLRNLVDRDLTVLKTLQANKIKEYYQQQYQEQIENKIEEAKIFLDILKQDISSRQQMIEPQIASLIIEVNKAKEGGSAQLITLQEKRRELEEALHKKMVFGVVSIAVQGIGMMFPPAGPIVAGVVNAGLSMAMNPSFETVMNFAEKVVEMKSQLGDLPTGAGDLPMGASTTKHEANLFKKIQEMAKTVAPLIKNAKDLLNQKNEGDTRLTELDSKIASLNAYIKELDAYLETVPTALGNYLEGMVHEVQSLQKALKDKSLVALDFSKLEIKRFFESMKRSIKAVVGKFGTSDGFEDIAIKMGEAIDASVNICSRVQDYRDHIAFANYIAHLQTAEVKAQAINVGVEYKSAVSKLELDLQQSVVQEAYYKAVAAIKQWAFPFAEKFLSAITNLEAKDYDTIVQNLTAILRRIEEYKTSITSMDQAIIVSSFNAAPTLPFFTWSYDHYPQKFESLLNGEKVILSADVRKTKLDAVKFKKIGIKLECRLSSKQAELNTILQDGYKVTLGHNGTSYYKYYGDIYQISSDKPIEIGYSFKMKENGVTPVQFNEVWSKMEAGDILLSPYTSWIVKIEKIETAPTTTEVVNLLDKFNDVKHHMKVSLTGEGSYVDTSRVNDDLLLDKYYHKSTNLELLEDSNFGISSNNSQLMLFQYKKDIVGQVPFVTTKIERKEEEEKYHTTP